MLRFRRRSISSRYCNRISPSISSLLSILYYDTTSTTVLRSTSVASYYSKYSCYLLASSVLFVGTNGRYLCRGGAPPPQTVILGDVTVTCIFVVCRSIRTHPNGRVSRVKSSRMVRHHEFSHQARAKRYGRRLLLCCTLYVLRRKSLMASPSPSLRHEDDDDHPASSIIIHRSTLSSSLSLSQPQKENTLPHSTHCLDNNYYQYYYHYYCDCVENQSSSQLTLSCFLSLLLLSSVFLCHCHYGSYSYCCSRYEVNQSINQ
jgi:hypothetical protein